MIRKCCIGILLLAGLAATAHAETRYVMDTIYISVRATQDDSSESVETIKSGTKLEVLGKSEDGEYLQVSTPSGNVGWVKERYVLDEPIARDKLESVEKKLEASGQEVGKLKSTVGDLRRKLQEAEKEVKRLNSQNQNLTNQNENMSRLAAKPLELSKTNEKLQAENAQMSSELEELRRETDVLKDTTSRDWFISGGVVVIMGVLIGLILPKLRFGRRSDWA